MVEASRRAIVCGAVALCAIPAAAKVHRRTRGDHALTLDEIIRHHTAARGGVAALDAIQSQSVELQMLENGDVLKGRYVCSKAPAYRIDVFDHGKHVFCEGIDANGPWIWPASQAAATQAVPDARRTGLEGIEFNLYGLHSFAARGHRLTLDGRELLGRTNHYVVRVDLKDSYRTFLYVDPETWMIVRRRDFRAPHPDVNDTKKNLEKQYSDFRAVSGVLTPFLEHQIDLATGKITQVSIVDRMTYNSTPANGVPDRTAKPA